MKMNKYGKGKYLLRHAFEGLGYLPDEILMREKAAFSDAVGHSMVDHLKQQIEKLLSTSRNPPVPESPEVQSCSKCSRNNNHSKVFK